MDAVFQSRAEELASEFASQATTVEELNELMLLALACSQRYISSWPRAVVSCGSLKPTRKRVIYCGLKDWRSK